MVFINNLANLCEIKYSENEFNFPHSYIKHSNGILEYFGITNMSNGNYKEVILEIPFVNEKYIVLTTYSTQGSKYNIVSASAVKKKTIVGFYCADISSTFNYHIIGKWK